jgi:hypothetical protein
MLKQILCSLLLLLPFACLWGCDGPPEKRETIKELRVLAIKAEPPAAKPGADIKLSTLLAGPSSQTASTTWYACPTTQTNPDLGCNAETGTKLTNTSGTSTTYTIPSDALKDLSPTEEATGRYLYLTLVVKTDKEEVTAVKRIVVSSTPANINPTIEAVSITATGSQTPLKSPFSVGLDAVFQLAVTLGPNAIETYQQIAPDGTTSQAKETIFVSWYTTEGEYEKGYLTKGDTRTNQWKTPKEMPESPNARLFVIVRDGRGGVSWQEVDVTLK